MVEKLIRYVKPFSYNTSVSRTDRRTDRRTDGRTDRITISISRVSSSMLTRDKNFVSPQQTRCDLPFLLLNTVPSHSVTGNAENTNRRRTVCGMRRRHDGNLFTDHQSSRFWRYRSGNAPSTCRLGSARVGPEGASPVQSVF